MRTTGEKHPDELREPSDLVTGEKGWRRGFKSPELFSQRNDVAHNVAAGHVEQQRLHRQPRAGW